MLPSARLAGSEASPESAAGGGCGGVRGLCPSTHRCGWRSAWRATARGVGWPAGTPSLWWWGGASVRGEVGKGSEVARRTGESGARAGRGAALRSSPDAQSASAATTLDHMVLEACRARVRRVRVGVRIAVVEHAAPPQNRRGGVARRSRRHETIEGEPRHRTLLVRGPARDAATPSAPLRFERVPQTARRLDPRSDRPTLERRRWCVCSNPDTDQPRSTMAGAIAERR